MTLPVAIIFSVVGMSITFSYLGSIYQKSFQLNYRIAETKALYNAESGIALNAHGVMSKEFIEYSKSSDISEMNGNSTDMGFYNVDITGIVDNRQNKRQSVSVGVSTVRNLYGKSLEVKRTKKLQTGAQPSLAEYFYLTDSEKAGGAPFVFDGAMPVNSQRRVVNFGAGDVFSQGGCDVEVKTNGTFVMSNYGCPQFNNTVYITEDSQGNVNSPQMGSCQESYVFQGDPPLDTVRATNLNWNAMESHYNTVNRYADLVLDATEMLNWTPGNFRRDTLIMTDIEFFDDNTGGFIVKRWWYLMPPYLDTDGFNTPFPVPNDLAGDHTGCPNHGPGDNDLRFCIPYAEAMANYHAKYLDLQGNENLINNIVQSQFGLHHFDFEDQIIDSHLLPEYTDGGVIYNYAQGESGFVIYVKGGPVRIHGTYKGRYSIFTDQATPYHRHAWGSIQPSPTPLVDTVFCNIWLTDDLKNTDGTGYQGSSLYSVQPEDGCVGGSENIMGLISGANIYVANTPENGARNNQWGDDIVIHAHMTAFGESFASHYFQNTISNGGYSNPPYGDGQGISLYGSTGNTDYRGNVILWGGIVQKYRGYLVRNNPGPYNTGDIGYDKDYHFDCNLKCNDPPLYPPDLIDTGSSENQEIDLDIEVYK